ncbi:MAG: SPOR domain-containing protein [Paludibacter sp.]|nr:SPOR domain-containing protein [Paludibacter sp.]
MNKTIRFFLALAIVAMTGTACKSKQKVAEIKGADIPATTTTTTPTVTTPVVNTTPEVVSSEAEVTRNETFSLSDGDAAALKFRYHVVVGSFKSQTNAKGLQSTLLSEGNQAIIVINEQGWYRVLIASFNEYSQARSKINQIKNRFADAWVLVQK